ncbi:hypothetical protein AALB16_10945 [Lachnospiraceae bacterium 62-35]
MSGEYHKRLKDPILCREPACQIALLQRSHEGRGNRCNPDTECYPIFRFE